MNSLVKLLIFILGLFLILQNLDIGITPLLTAFGIGGLAVALALQDTLSNLFAGIAIILGRQIRPNDYLQLSGGEEGFVVDVKAPNTTIRTFPRSAQFLYASNMHIDAYKIASACHCVG